MKNSLSKMQKILILIFMMLVIIMMDQITKYVVVHIYHFQLGEFAPVIKGFFNITHVQNTGAAFGFLADASLSVRKVMFLWIPVAACIWFLWLAYQSMTHNYFLAIAYSMIFAGAVGNLIDRFRLGYVVDFLDFHWGQAHFPAFNVADSSISIAAGMFLIDFFIQSKKTSIGAESKEEVGT